MEFGNIPRIVLCVTVALCCMSGSATGQTAHNPKLSVEERVFIASQIYALVQVHFVDGKRASDPRLTAFYEDYLRKALASDDRRQFDLATMEFVAQFHNGHTLFWDSWLGEFYGQPLGFYAAPLDGKWVIRTSSLDGLKPGDVLATVDNVGVQDLFQKTQKYISASSEAAQRRNLFLLPYLFSEQFSLTLEGDRTMTVNRASVKEHHDDVEGRWLKPGELAYVRIPDFFSPLLQEKALTYVRQFQKAKALIIDVRNNPGGIPPTRLIEALMDRPYRGWKESTPMRIGSLDYYQGAIASDESNTLREYTRGYMDALTSLGDPQLIWNPRSIEPDPTAYKGKVIVLVDGGCVSACEDLIEPFKDNGRAILVGETTEGSSGLPFFYDFHNGMSVKIAVKRDYLPDGTEFEGIGIKPDIEVSPSIEDLKHGRDIVLERATELARESH